MPTDRSERRTLRRCSAACIVVALAAMGCGDSEGAEQETVAAVSAPRSPNTATGPATSAPESATPSATSDEGPPGSTESTPDSEPERADPAIFDYDASADVSYEVINTLDFRGIEMQRIKFESPVGGMAYGYLAEPVGEPVPGVGILRAHGAPVDGTDEFIPMSMLACAGVISVVVDAPYARPGANRSGEALLFTPEDRAEQVQLIVDMRRAIDLLADRGVERIGFGGISYGASIGGLLLGVEPRIETAALILGNGGVLERFFDEHGEPVWPLTDRSDDEIDAWRSAMAPVEPIRFIGASDASILFMNGADDQLIPPVEAERYHAAGPPDSEVFWMDIDHDIPFEDMRNVHNHWLGEHLGIDLDRLDHCTDELFPDGW